MQFVLPNKIVWYKARRYIFLILGLLSIVLLLYQCVMVRYNDDSSVSFKEYIKNTSLSQEDLEKPPREHIVITTVICGSKNEFAMVMIKSAILFKGDVQLTFVIFAEFHLQADLHLKLQRLQTEASKDDVFSYELRNISYPPGEESRWRRLDHGKPCTAVRLLIPTILINHTSVLYVDVDTIFLNELSDAWRHLHQMNESQIAAVSPDHENQDVNPYSLRDKNIIPFYGNTGLNAGVILMNLTRMREIKWLDHVNAIFQEYEERLDGADQDIINIFFHFHPDKLYLNSCKYNYNYFLTIEGSHCMKESLCKDAVRDGVTIMHGHSGAFSWQNTFRSIYQTFRDYGLGTDIDKNLIYPLSNKFQSTYCTTLEEEFMGNLVRLFNKKYVPVTSLT